MAKLARGTFHSTENSWLKFPENCNGKLNGTADLPDLLEKSNSSRDIRALFLNLRAECRRFYVIERVS